MLSLPIILHAQYIDQDSFLVENHSRDASLTIDSEFVMFTFSKKVLTSTNDAMRSGLHSLSYEFEDTSGNVIPPEDTPLNDNSVRISLTKIQNLILNGDRLRFQYYSEPNIRFEDVRTSNGERLIDSFTVEQIYEFTKAFYRLKSD